jgi:hypothetical protein
VRHLPIFLIREGVIMETMKVKPWGENQGDHVIIDKHQFDPKIHEEIGGKSTGGQKTTGKRSASKSQPQQE